MREDEPTKKEDELADERHGDDERGDERDETVLYECRHCGGQSRRPRAWCWLCGSIEIARYRFQSGAGDLA